MSEQEPTTQEVRGIELLVACEEHQRKEAGRKRKAEHEAQLKTLDGENAELGKDKEMLELHQKDDEEAELEDIVLGGSTWDKSRIESDEEAPIKKRMTTKMSHRNIDLDDHEESWSEEQQQSIEDDEIAIERKPVWEDDDDQCTVNSKHEDASFRDKTLSVKLREKHEKIFSRPKWATQAEKKIHLRNEEANQLLRTATSFVDTDPSMRPLGSGLLDFTRCPQMNKFCFQHSPLVALAFHPSSEIAMTAHKNGVITFFNIDAKECNKIQSVYFKDFDISCAKLSSDGMQMMAGSIRYRSLHCYDLMSGTRTQVTFPKAHELTHMKRFEVSPCGRYLAIHGRFGKMYVICAQTKQQIATLKMNEDVTSTVFTRDGRMISHGQNYVYLWDIGVRRCVQKFLDDGCLKGQTLALSADERFLATGCDSGIVNVYDAQYLLKGRDASRTPKPLKCVKNIVTPVTSLAFNESSEILLIASRYKPEAVKMVHTGSLTAFSNFPGVRHKFRNPSCAAFSPNGGFLALGSTIGAANLIRINHYGNY
ncbi:U3 small nucleolar RNA-associated protein 18 homolog [Varroa jacobsoni]|uniref:U3 small nucleolar RNA-associated protein 18 homolog n=1 Tax=Varroa jacobsoni TaxID=62625 RepID=UPI000BF3E644|nr:U3 small nucleolar RNA-associated protein 18 homolog [Varroa jacobsoni]XP_022688222.1 U3 small nucleolar RNA-associated protein 18 homolog [Varroa jacobsoni]